LISIAFVSIDPSSFFALLLINSFKKKKKKSLKNNNDNYTKQKVRFYKVGAQGQVSAAMKYDRHLAFSNACKKASIRAVKEVRMVEADSESMEEGVVAQLLTSGVRILHLVRVSKCVRQFVVDFDGKNKTHTHTQ
jgi:hypothetical protein